MSCRKKSGVFAGDLFKLPGRLHEKGLIPYGDTEGYERNFGFVVGPVRCGDHDNDVDFADFAVFQRAFTGPL